VLKLGLVALLASSARDYFEKGKMQLQGNLAKVGHKFFRPLEFGDEGGI
jgi:hypothetical protein